MIQCLEAYQCANRTTNSTSSIANYGYKSGYGPLSFISAQTSYISCFGAFSCANTATTKAKDIRCDGENSCSNSLNIKGTSLTSTIRAFGANALKNTSINGPFSTIQCDGEQSCAYSIIRGCDETSIYGDGAYSLLNAAIDTINNTATLDIYLRGYYSGFGANITCRSGSNCTVYCVSDGCINLSFNCDQNCILVNIISNDTILPINNNISAYYDMSRIFCYDINNMTKHNDDACTSQPNAMNIDDHKESYDIPLNVFFNATARGPFCCRGYRSCQAHNSDFNIEYKLSLGESIICSGAMSCMQTIIMNNGSVFCNGANSCVLATIDAFGDIYCTSYASCASANISAPHIYCSGSSSCESSSIISADIDLNVHFLGYRAGAYSNIVCSSTNKCSILCKGYQSCLDVNLVCNNDSCSVYCDQDTLCPNITTNNPSLNLSLYPSFCPSNAPSFVNDVNDVNDVSLYRMDISVIILIVSLSVVLLSIVLVPIYRCFKKTQLGLKLAEDIDIQQNSQQKDNINNNNNNNESETKEDKLFIVNNLETQGMTPMELHKKANKDAFEVQDWLENIVQLPQYFEMLMNSGYEAMSFIKEIPNIIELFEIGIESKEHQTKLWEEIQKLKGEKQQNDKLNQLIVAAEQTFESGENTKREGSIAIL